MFVQSLCVYLVVFKISNMLNGMGCVYIFCTIYFFAYTVSYGAYDILLSKTLY